MAFRGQPVIGAPAFATPTGAVHIGDAAAQGVGPAAASSQHVHAFPAPAAGYVTDIASLLNDGALTAAARADHQHRIQSLLLAPGGAVDLSGIYNTRPATAAGHRYVTTGGNNANDGLTWATAKATIAGAVAALPASGGHVHVAAGTFSMTADVALTVTGNGGITIEGVSPVLTTLQRANGTVNLTANIFSATGAGVFAFRHLTIDGNSANQTFTGATTANWYKAITGDGNNGATNNGTLVVDDVWVLNMAMGGTITQGLAVNTFGFSTQFIRGLRTDNVDKTLFITQAFATTPNQTFFDGIFIHNPNDSGVEFEATGGVVGTNLQVLADAASNATGVRILTSSQDIHDVHLAGAVFRNLGYPVNIGGGTTLLRNSSLTRMTARTCKGSFNISSADSSCIFDGLIANGCATGGIPSATVFGSFELGGGTGADRIYLFNSHSIGSGNNGLQLNAPATIRGGSVRNWVGSAINASAANLQASDIRQLTGFNDAGPVAVTLPATGVAWANPHGVPITLHVFSGTVTGVTKGGVQLTNVGPFTVNLEPGESVTISYTGGAPIAAADRH